MTDTSRISGFVANNAATSYIITWSGYSWERVISQQRSFNSKSSGSKLPSNQTCSQFSVSPEHKGCRLYHWSTSIFLQSCFKQIQYVPHGKERIEDCEEKKEKGTWGRSNCSKEEVGTGKSVKEIAWYSRQESKGCWKEERCNCDEGFVSRIKCFQGKSRANPKEGYSSSGQRNKEDRRENLEDWLKGY